MNDLEDFDWEAYLKEPRHPLHLITLEGVPLSEFLKQCVVMYKDTAIVWYKDKPEEWPVIVFKNYDKRKIKVFNITKFSFFEILKFKEHLSIVKTEGDELVLLMDDCCFDEEFKGDRATIEMWKRKKAAEEKRAAAKRWWWIPNTVDD